MILSKYKIFFGSFTYYFLATVITSLSSLVMFPILADYLSLEDFGIIGYFTSFNLLFLPLVSFYFFNYLSRSYFLLPNQAERVRLRNLLMTVQLGLGGIVLAVSLAAFYYYEKLAQIEYPFFPYAILALSLLFFSGWKGIYMVELKLAQRAKHFLVFSAMCCVLSVLLQLFFVVWLKYQATGYLLALMLSELFVLIGIYFGVKVKFTYDFKEAKQILWFCLPLIIAASLEFFYVGVDRTMLEKYNDTTLYGLYNIGVRISGFLMVFATALYQTFQSDIFEKIANNNMRGLCKILALVNGINILLVGAFIIAAPLAVYILTNGLYGEAAGFSQIMALRNIPMLAYFCVSSTLLGFGFNKFIMWNKIIGCVSCLLLFYFLIKYFEYYGGAWGQAISYVPLCLCAILFLCYQYKFHPENLKNHKREIKK